MATDGWEAVGPDLYSCHSILERKNDCEPSLPIQVRKQKLRDGKSLSKIYS